jgi:hypothetical protein
LMPKTNITFKMTLSKGAKAGGLKVQEYSLPGNPPSPIVNITLKKWKGVKALESDTAYTLIYGYFGEPNGAVHIEVTAEDGTKLLDEKDSIDSGKLADTGKFTFKTP